jgi:hypothetical protein
MCQPPNEIARTRTRQLLQFLREFQRLKKPPIRSVAEYSWHLALSRLPRHPFVTVGQVVETDSRADAGAVDGVILRIRRPPQTPCPQPPSEPRDWLLPGWQKIEGGAKFLTSRNELANGAAQTVRFEADEERVRSRQEWMASCNR